jgi:hypothetical protein
LLIAAMGEPLDDDERVILKAITGREHEPGARVESFWAERVAGEASRELSRF